MKKKWATEFRPGAYKEFKKLDQKVQKQVFEFLDRLVEKYASPREIGLALRGGRAGLWRYRVGDYRVVCEIQDHKLIILILDVEHRKDIYKGLSRFLH